MSVRRRKRIGVVVPIASMGDIAFLLIIFFMLTSNFIQEAHVKLSPAGSTDIHPVDPGTVTVSMDGEGKLWLQGQPCAVEALASEVAAVLKDKPSKQVMLKIDKDLPHQQYGPVYIALSQATDQITLIGSKIEE